jgi:hypothetical protein
MIRNILVLSILGFSHFSTLSLANTLIDSSVKPINQDVKENRSTEEFCLKAMDQLAMIKYVDKLPPADGPQKQWASENISLRGSTGIIKLDRLDSTEITKDLNLKELFPSFSNTLSFIDLYTVSKNGRHLLLVIPKKSLESTSADKLQDASQYMTYGTFGVGIYDFDSRQTRVIKNEVSVADVVNGKWKVYDFNSPIAFFEGENTLLVVDIFKQTTSIFDVRLTTAHDHAVMYQTPEGKPHILIQKYLEMEGASRLLEIDISCTNAIFYNLPTELSDVRTWKPMLVAGKILLFGPEQHSLGFNYDSIAVFELDGKRGRLIYMPLRISMIMSVDINEAKDLISITYSPDSTSGEPTKKVQLKIKSLLDDLGAP